MHMVEVQLTIEGRVHSLIPLLSAMEVRVAETMEECCNTLHIEGSLLIDEGYFRGNTVAGFITNALKDADCYGRYVVPSPTGDERAKFACFDKIWYEIEIDEWGSFRFPDPGSLAELPDFAARELDDMREFLRARDAVVRKLTPVSARYGDTLSALHAKYGGIMADNPVFEEVLKSHVESVQDSTRLRMTSYDAVEFLLDNLGPDGVDLVLAVAGRTTATKAE